MRLMNVNDDHWMLSRPRQATDPIQNLWRNFDQLVEGRGATSTSRFVPTCDINETENHYMISFDVPGLESKDLAIEVVENELIVSGERSKRTLDKESETSVFAERSFGKFQRTFSLPKTVDVEKIEAQCKNGVLNVALPKAEAAKPKSIQIQSGESQNFVSRFLGLNSRPKSLDTEARENIKVS